MQKKMELETRRLIAKKEADGTMITRADITRTALRLGVPVSFYVLWMRYWNHMSWDDIAGFALYQLGINSIYKYFNLPWYTPTPAYSYTPEW